MFSAPCVCCKYGDEYDKYVFTSDSRFTPDSGIIIHDYQDPASNQNVNNLRPSFNHSTGVVLKVPTDNNYPYVEIDLDEPYLNSSYLDIAEVKISGNVETVRISTKLDNETHWMHTADLNVNPNTDVVSLPMAWRTGKYDTVTIGKIKIEVLNATAARATNYTFKVFLVGCYGIGKNTGRFKTSFIF